MTTKAMGDRGEQLAAEYLEAKGYTVLERNYRFEKAEVDLVCFVPSAQGLPGGEIVFVEVKTRAGTGFGAPEDAVTPTKQRLIAKAAEAFLYEYRLEGARCRFDVVAVQILGDHHEVEHYEDAFWSA